VNPDREFFLLAVLGADLPGALVVTPFEGESKQVGPHQQEEEIITTTIIPAKACCAFP